MVPVKNLKSVPDHWYSNMNYTLKELHAQACKIHGETEVKARLRRFYLRLLKVNAKPKSPDAELYNKILDDLNRVSGFAWELCENTKKLIKARCDEGATLDIFTKIHAYKAQEWLKNPDCRKYLRPSTLYRKSNWDRYKQESNNAKSRNYKERNYKPGW